MIQIVELGNTVRWLHGDHGDHGDDWQDLDYGDHGDDCRETLPGLTAIDLAIIIFFAIFLSFFFFVETSPYLDIVSTALGAVI